MNPVCNPSFYLTPVAGGGRAPCPLTGRPGAGPARPGASERLPHAAQEGLARRHLIHRHKFIGLVGLFDMAGAADHSGNADALEQTDLCRQERAQFSALLDALRIEVGLCQEVLA